MAVIFPDNWDDPISLDDLDDWEEDREITLEEAQMLAAELRKRAAKLDHANALEILSEDDAFTPERLQRWVDQNQSWAQNMLGMYYYNGKYVQQDKALGHYWFLKAAKRGDYAAQYNIGKAYYDGDDGVPMDWNEAKHWLELSAAQECEEAEALLKELLDAEAAQSRAQEEEARQRRLAQTRKELTEKQEVLLSEKAELDQKLSAVEEQLQQADEKIDAAFSQKEEDQAVAEKTRLQTERDELTGQLALLKRSLKEIRQALAAAE